jgi:hypothetical protein
VRDSPLIRVTVKLVVPDAKNMCGQDKRKMWYKENSGKFIPTHIQIILAQFC